MRFRHDSGYRSTMSGDDYGLPTLDVIEELGKVSFGLRSLNFAHGPKPHLVWSIRLVDLYNDDEESSRGRAFGISAASIRSLASLSKDARSTFAA
jgi:hypothetical protein